MAIHDIRQLLNTPPPRPRTGQLTIRPLSPSKVGKQIISHRARSLSTSTPASTFTHFMSSRSNHSTKTSTSSSSSESKSYSPLDTLTDSDDEVPISDEPPTQSLEPSKLVTLMRFRQYTSSIENFFRAAVDTAIERCSNSPNEVEQFFQDSADTRRPSLDVDRLLKSMEYDEGSTLKKLHDSDGEPLQDDDRCETCEAKARRSEVKIGRS
ncbi:hypothetical protein PENSPDRAFT_701637 [Peniophora sp. CONT]|nr:hypothetical protein PENSPDRAFT_701637 [Peniophora sp. CONT]